MLPTIETGEGETTLVLLHLFGSSKREWNECTGHLSVHYHCVAMDLPGFGDASAINGYGVEEMASAIETTLLAMQIRDCILVGHSMSGKVALAIAARGSIKVSELILVTPSPPSPEPIPDKGRAQMLAMKRDRQSAEVFLDQIVAKPLKGLVRERAIQDFMQCSPDAWAAWLNSGIREDWTNRIGTITCPTLVITGSADPTLGAAVQEQTTMHSLGNGWLDDISDCGHLPTMETPDKLSTLILNFIEIAKTLN